MKIKVQNKGKEKSFNMKNNEGLLITLEGVDGSGKTTHIGLLKESLEKSKYTVHVTREPGGTRATNALRESFLNHPESWDIGAEALLFLALRRQHVTHSLERALNDHDFVLSDRFTDSTFAYQIQFLSDSDTINWQKISQFSANNLKPSCTILLIKDLNHEEMQNQDWFETHLFTEDNQNKKQKRSIKTIQDHYRKIANDYPERFRVIETSQLSIKETHHRICAIISDQFNISCSPCC